MDQPHEPEIAIIGMAGRFPGASDVDAFWHNILAGRECFTTFTDEELIAAGVSEQQLQDPHYVRTRPVLDDVRSFDAGFFGLSPRDATLTDPQQRLFTECAWEALEMAGYGAAGARGAVGVYAGTNYSTYLTTRSKAMRRTGADAAVLMGGNDKDALATTASYRLDLRGPSMAVQTFCSTSLVSVHLACGSLRRGECDLAIAGGVSIRLPDRVGYLYQEGNQASPDGHVRTFDAQARGSMFGDGVAVVTLKRLDRALADRDTVLAVICGSAANNDGALKFSYHAPSIEGQRRCVSAALGNAGVDANDISYVEAHGTATEVGDPMEVAALTGAFGATEATQSEKQHCVLGSVKPNVGHLDRASGATGLIKVIQSLRHGTIPGTRNFDTPNPEIDFPNSPFRVTAEPTPWPRQVDQPRVAGISSLGTGGTNCHVIVREAPVPPARPPRPRRWQLLPISTRWADGADQACAALAGRLADDPGLELGDVAYTLQTGRQLFGHRRVVVAESTEQAAELLAAPAGPLGRVDATIGRKVCYLIAGVGEQYPGMVADLYADEPEFRADVQECAALLGLGPVEGITDLFTPAAAAESADLAALLGRTPAAVRSSATADELVQPVVFIAEYALARQLMRWGITPDVMVGYSLGEYVAACLSGVLTLADAIRLVAFRARLISGLPRGAMLAVGADERRTSAALGSRWDELDIAVRTGSQLVLAGPIPAIAAAAEVLRDAAIGCRQLATPHAYHSRLLEPAAAELTAWIRDNVPLRPPSTPYISNVTGELASAELVTDPSYWARHMCQTVEFGAGLAHALAGEHAVVEIGAGQSLGALARAHPTCRPEQWPLVVATLPSSDRPATRTVAEAAARLWLAGVTIDWSALHGSWQPGRVPLPTYPFDRRECWLDEDAAGADDSAEFDLDDPATMLALPLLPQEQWLSVPVWRQTTARPPHPAHSGPWLVYTDAGRADLLAADLAAEFGEVTLVRPGSQFGIGLDGLTVRPGSTEDAAALLRHLSAQNQGPGRIVHLWNLGDDDAEAELRGLYTLIALARAAGELGLPPWTLDVVTRASHRVHPGDPVQPDRATALGPCRLIPVEYPGVRARLIDVDEQTLLRHAGAVRAELCAEPANQVVALRGGRRWVPEYEVLDHAADPAPTAAFRRGGAYLVTGGLGGVGLALAERIVAEHDARVVLLGRTPVPPPRQWPGILDDHSSSDEVRRRVAGLQRLGARAITVAGDVSDPAAVRRAADAAIQAFGRLDGVLHCAGVPAVGMMQFKSAGDVARVLAPKVAGARSVVAAVRDLDVDFVALFSSTTSATGGGPGQVDYCAANAFLDAFADSDPLPGVLVTSLDWGEWEWNGWTAGLNQYDAGSRQFFDTYRRTFGITFDAGFAALQRVLRTGERHVVVSTQDFPTIVAMSRRSSIASQQETVRRARDAGGQHPRPELSTQYVEPQTPAEEAIATVWAQALGLDRVGSHDNFFELGGNSLVGMEIIAQVRTALGVPHLPPHLLYQAPTVATLAQAVAETEADGDDAPAEVPRLRHQTRIEARRSALQNRRSA